MYVIHTQKLPQALSFVTLPTSLIVDCTTYNSTTRKYKFQIGRRSNIRGYARSCFTRGYFVFFSLLFYFSFPLPFLVVYLEREKSHCLLTFPHRKVCAGDLPGGAPHGIITTDDDKTLGEGK